MSMRINMIHEITVKQAEVLLDWRDWCRVYCVYSLVETGTKQAMIYTDAVKMDEQNIQRHGQKEEENQNYAEKKQHWNS